ncbi:MAG: hypothetical protein JRI52_08885 [Deltaproteobacteria bacterium]|nr:hypothetical protein [Deltaproteobacteria bacterium]
MGDEWKKEFLEKIDPFYTQFVDTLNLLDFYSMTFTKKVAFEEAAFDCVGITFCWSVEDYYPMIALARDNSEDKMYCNLLELYTIWSNRLKKDELKERKKKTNEKLSCFKDVCIKPVGVGDKNT